jgi:hypothetical protein
VPQAAKRVWFKQVTLNDTDWTPIYPAFDCHHIAVRNLSDARIFGWMNKTVFLRSDSDDPTTEVELAPNAQEGVVAAPADRYADRLGKAGAVNTAHRFLASEVVFYAQSSSGTCNVVVVTVN